MKKFLMLHGVNHNMFGKRDPKQYGTITLDQINEELQSLAKELEVEVSCFQTNSEAEMCERIHRAFQEQVDGVMLNAGAWTHYSYAIRDALAILTVPVVELHMSQHSCTRGVSASVGLRGNHQGSDLRLRRRQLPARVAGSGVRSEHRQQAVSGSACAEIDRLHVPVGLDHLGRAERRSRCRDRARARGRRTRTRCPCRAR